MVLVGQSMCIEMAGAASRQPGRAVECRGDERIYVRSNLQYLFEDKVNREMERPLIVQHGLLAVLRAVLQDKWRGA